jgi:hypothetical protein
MLGSQGTSPRILNLGTRRPWVVRLMPCVLSEQNREVRQCTYNVTMRRVRETLLSWKSSKLCLSVCVQVLEYVRVWGASERKRVYSLAYPACNAYAPYCDVICSPWGSTKFFWHYLTKGAIFGKKKLLNIKFMFSFSLQILFKHFSF